MLKKIVSWFIVPAVVFSGTIVFGETAEIIEIHPVATVILVQAETSIAVIQMYNSIPMKNGDILQLGTVVNGRKLTVIDAQNPKAVSCSIENDAATVLAGATVYRVESGKDFEDRADLKVAVNPEKKIQKQHVRNLDETTFSLGAFVRRSDYRAHSTVYTNDGSAGVAGGFLNLNDRGNSFEFQYKRPQFSGKKYSADEYSGEGMFRSFLDKPNSIALYGKAGFHYLKDAKDFETSSYASAKLSLSALELFSDPEVSYEQKYFFDDFGGDRKKIGDYTASFKIRPLRKIIPDIFKAGFTLFYASENYAEKESTPLKEGKKGFRDVSSELYIDEKYLRAGLLWSRIIDKDWSRITGKNQVDLYGAIKIDLDEFRITLRYDYLKQNNSTILKKE